MSKYISLTGHNYKPEGAKEEKRVEIGGDVSDMPKSSLELEKQAGKVKEVKEEKPTPPAKGDK
jgi:hypothetical protein